MTLSRYQLERTDLLTEIEQGRKVEIALFRENTRSMDTLGNLLFNRWFSKTEDIRLWEKRRAYAERDRWTYPRSHLVEHGPECPCDGCLDAVKRLLIDCGVLPGGYMTRSDRLDFTTEPLTARLTIPARYRRDESDR